MIQNTVRFLLFAFTVVFVLLIIVLFLLTFIRIKEGPNLMIFATFTLISIGVLYVLVHILEHQNETYLFILSKLHKFISIVLNYILLTLSSLLFFSSILIYLATNKFNYLLNSGCFIAFIMVIILIDLFIRILLPLIGFDHNI
jgi:hypothetical protein